MTNKIGLHKNPKKGSIFSSIIFDSSYSSSLVTKTAVTGYNVYKIDAATSALTTLNVPSYSVGATINAKSNFTMYYLCIGGGGLGSNTTNWYGSNGGGAGAFIEGSINILTDTTINIVFTAGGLTSTGNGLDSSIVYGSTTVTGGHGGGVDGTTPTYGGSGAGGYYPVSGTTSGQAGVLPGKNGGIGRYAVGDYYGGGGGGAGSAGNNQDGGTGKAATAGTGINLLTGATVFCAGGPGRGYVSGTGGGTTYGCGGAAVSSYYGKRGAIYFAIPTSAIP